MCKTNISELNYISACFTEFMVGKEFMVGRVHGWQRVHGWKRVHNTIEKGQAELATHSACVTLGEPKCVCHGVHGR